MKLPREWSELIDLLCLHRVRFPVVGAHALAAIGRPRATVDLDLLVEPRRGRGARISGGVGEARENLTRKSRRGATSGLVSADAVLLVGLHRTAQ